MGTEKKSAWKTIRDYFTKDTIPNSVGYQSRLNLAADLFIALLPNLQNQDAEKAEFNADTELKEALIIRKGLNELGMLKMR